MNHREIGRERGRTAAAKQHNLQEEMKREALINLSLFPTLGEGFDLLAGVLAYDKARLECVPEYARFPETRGLVERAIGEREGFIESSGLNETHAAFHYSWRHYLWKYINARHVARYDLIAMPNGCTNVFFPEGRDGVTTSDNRDDVPVPWYEGHVPSYRVTPPRKGEPIQWVQGSVSSTILLDDEPECTFPYNPYEHVPNECLDDVRVLVSWMDERRDFWGPYNQIWADRNHNAVAVEKSNVRAAYHYPTTSGAVCVTACSYLDPELNDFKRGRLQEVARRKGEEESCAMDLKYSDDCDLRHRRLWKLTNEEAARLGGATLWGALEVVNDTAVPFPERICLAGEKTGDEPTANWTLTQNAQVLTGPHRRALYRSIQSMKNPRPIWEEPLKLVLGEGVEMRPEWQRDIDEGRCVLA